MTLALLMQALIALWIILLQRPIYFKWVAAVALLCANLINSDISSGMKSIVYIVLTLMLLIMVDDWDKTIRAKRLK